MSIASLTPAASLTPQALADALTRIIGRERVLTRPIERVAYASDASFYRLIPQAVVLAKGVGEVQGLFQFSRTHRVPMTFRAAGTSLSGQAVTDGILVEAARHWRQVQVEDGGKRVRVQPGVIGGHVNQALKAFRAKMGPDPASINTCMMGGILANNSSGMCCGVTQNAYHTLDSITFVLPSGTVIDTADPDADESFRQREPVLCRGLLDLKREIEANPLLTERIRAKYRMKNTTGYSLNAFVDFERPVDIFRNLLIGSEGTLAFIAEAVLNTVPDLPVKYTGLLLFPSVHAACAAIAPLRDADAKALELMDRASLRSVEDQPGIPPNIKGLPAEAAGLLVEFQAAEEADRTTLEKLARDAVGGLQLLEPGRFHPRCGRAGAPVEDPPGPVPFGRRSAQARDHGDHRGRGLSDPEPGRCHRGADPHGGSTRLRRGDRLRARQGRQPALHDHPVVQHSGRGRPVRPVHGRHGRLVVTQYDGALKAEHGTGRNIAPFVETEWGPEAYAIMKRLKGLVDPDGILNPGVILNPDPKAHLADLKSLPGIEDEVDKCIECGYCESKCPSHELTLTPRQRIVVRREMVRLKEHGGDGELAALEAAFPYMALDTCAVDGLCATACPVSINTGDLTKRFRRLRHPEWAQGLARHLAEHFALVEAPMRLGLWMGHATQSLLGAATMVGLTRAIRALIRQPFPQWSREMPRPASGRPPVTQKAGAQAVYFPACISRVMGHLPGEIGRDEPHGRFRHRGATRGKVSLDPRERGGNLLRSSFLVQGVRSGARGRREPGH